MAGKIFINYRRGDDPGFTQALYMRLEDEFSAADLFMDVEGHIKPGDDFVEVLGEQVAASDILLVVIGPRWDALLDARQGSPDDFVAIEIKAALDQGKRLIPVLVGGADMPRSDGLPESIRALARRNAVGLRPERFKSDCQGLVNALKDGLASAEREREARTVTERRAAEAERKALEAEEAARVAANEERARRQAVAGLSAEEIRKAEELANWDFIKSRGNTQVLRDHLARFPGGVTALYATTRIEEQLWAGLGDAPSLTELRAFIDEFPNGANAKTAATHIALLEKDVAAAQASERQRLWDAEAWSALAASKNIGAIEAFLRDRPNGPYSNAAQARISELRRGAGGFRRGHFIGASAIALMVGAVAAAWFYFHQLRLLPTFWNISASTITSLGEQTLKPGQMFRECPSCPEMIVVPAGTFSIGSPSAEVGRSPDEGPQRKVIFRQNFAMGKYEVTFDEWDACVAHNGCQNVATDSTSVRGRRPIANVNWNDAKQYAGWLAKVTGKAYRLPSEAEWEYAARAGSAGRFSFGEDEAQIRLHAWNQTSSYGHAESVGAKKANAYRLHDMLGNVWEWVEDCWASNYNGLPVDGTARDSGECLIRGARGGMWLNGVAQLRSASRGNFATSSRAEYLGFRVARTIGQ